MTFIRNAGLMDTAFSTREEPRLYKQVRANIYAFKVFTCLYDRFTDVPLIMHPRRHIDAPCILAIEPSASPATGHV
jgi:hypothetical protein